MSITHAPSRLGNRQPVFLVPTESTWDDWTEIRRRMAADPVGQFILRQWTAVTEWFRGRDSTPQPARPAPPIEPLELVFDLTHVGSRSDFARVMATYFPVIDDRRELWRGIFWTELCERRPCHIRFTGWSCFARRMPRYARRLRRYFDQYQWRHGLFDLTVWYD